MRILLALIIGALGVATVGVGAVLAQGGEDGPPAAEVTLRDAQGQVVGTVELTVTRFGTIDVEARTRRGLRSGWHGFHVHAVGRCDGPSFASAGGHLNPGGRPHGAHAGDLAPLLVKGNGTATARLTTDGFGFDDLRDADGSAIIVHAGADNFANIPPRYAPGGPDQETLATGDSGARVACGVVGG